MTEEKKTFGKEWIILYLLIIFATSVISLSILVSGKIIAGSLSSIKALSIANIDPIEELKTISLPKIDDYDPKYGNGKDILIFEYTDYQCPFCARYTINVFPLIYDNYVKTGLATYVYKDLPLEGIHPYATVAAIFANCVYKNYGIEKYSEFKKWLFENASLWANPNYLSIFREKLNQIGIEYNIIEACINGTEVLNDITEDLGEVNMYKFTGTPSFLIALNRNKITTEEFESLKDKLEELLEYGLRYKIWRSEDGKYILIAFSGALPYNFFDSILSLVK